MDAEAAQLELEVLDPPVGALLLVRCADADVQSVMDALTGAPMALDRNLSVMVTTDPNLSIESISAQALLGAGDSLMMAEHEDLVTWLRERCEHEGSCQYAGYEQACDPCRAVFLMGLHRQRIRGLEVTIDALAAVPEVLDELLSADQMELVRSITDRRQADPPDSPETTS